MNTAKDYKEGKLAKEIEDKTARIPSNVYMCLAVASMGASLILKLKKKDKLALFIGQWAAAILIIGVYNKIVKTQGSE